WHPFFGLSLSVHKRKQTTDGERVFCRHPDGTLCSIPNWMLRPECAQFSLGPPLIAVKALCDLRNLLASWQAPGRCDKALLKSPTKEAGDETTSKATQPSAESATPQGARDRGSRPQTKRIGAYTDGATNHRGPREQISANRHRRGK